MLIAFEVVIIIPLLETSKNINTKEWETYVEKCLYCLYQQNKYKIQLL